MDAEDLIERCKALGHRERVRLLELLAQPQRFPDNLVDPAQVGICVNDLAAAAGLAQSTASGHIAKLRRAGLVSVEQVGTWRYVRADNAELDRLAAAISGLGS